MPVVDAENQKIDALLGAYIPPLAAHIESPADLADLRARWAELTAVPVVAEDRGAGADNSWAELDVRTIVGGEQSAGRFAVHSVVLAPAAELPAHYFDDTHSYLLVAKGEVDLGIGATRDTVGQHSLGYAPPRTRQSLRNSSDSPATVVMIHSPAGSERAFQDAHRRWQETGAREIDAYADVLARYGIRFDGEPLENDPRTNQELPPVDFEIRAVGDMARLRELFADRPPVPRLVKTTRDEFDAAAAGGITRRKELLNGDLSAGTAMFNMLSGVPGMNAPAHHQPTEEEFFFVTGGVLTLTCGTATMPLTAGAVAFAPRNCTHGFVNETDAEARFVTLNSPAGHERSLAQLRRLAEEKAPPEKILAAAAAGGWVIHDSGALLGVPRR